MHMKDVLDKTAIEQQLVEMTGQSFDRLSKTLLLQQTSSSETFQTVNNISRSTVRNLLRESGLRARTAARGPMLTVAHRRARLQYARDHVNCPMRNWNNVFFSDESRFCLYGNDRRPRAWHRQGQRYERFLRPIAAYGGGSVMVWPAFSRDYRTPLVIVRDTLNARRYIDQILRPPVLPLATNRRGFIFMKDNGRPHTANITRQFFQRNKIILIWII